MNKKLIPYEALDLAIRKALANPVSKANYEKWKMERRKK